MAQGRRIASHPAHPHLAMSDSGEDDVILEDRATASLRRGRPGMESLLHQPGPAILVAVVASPEGRWAAELTAPNAEARAARELLLQVLHTGETSLRPAHDSPRVIGAADFGELGVCLGASLQPGHLHAHGCQCLSRTEGTPETS